MSWADDMSRDQVEHPERWGLELDDMGNPVEPIQEWSGEMQGLKSIEGTFSGLLDSMPPEWVGDGTEIRELFFYGPDMTAPRWKHWFWRIREALGGKPYPTILLASGPATLSIDSEEPVPGVTLVSGTFTRTGEWWVDPSISDAGDQKP